MTPPLDGPPTGGTLFGARLIHALRALGVDARRISLEEASVAPAQNDLWVDSLYLSAVPDLARRAPGRVHLCLHYLPSLVEHGVAWHPSVLGAAERAALETSRFILVPSAWLGRLIEQAELRAGTWFVVEPGVTSGETLRVEPSSSRGPLRAVMVANVVPGKGVLPFLSALERAFAGDPNVEDRLTLTIVGSLDAAPDYAASCREAALGSRVARAVRFTGSLSPRAAHEAIAGSDVLVSPSRMESYGMALAEARALGVPIVALRGGNAEAHVSEAAGGAAFDDDDALARELAVLEGRRDELDARRRRAFSSRTARTWGDAARDFLEKVALHS